MKSIFFLLAILAVTGCEPEADGKTSFEFEEKFLNKIEGTINEYKTNPNYSPFLKHFGSYKAMNLEKQYEFIDVMNSNMITILDRISYMQKDIDRILNKKEQEEKRKFYIDLAKKIEENRNQNEIELS